jgi:hypothetical protein
VSGSRHAVEDEGAEVVEGSRDRRVESDEMPGESRIGALIRAVCTDLRSPKPKNEAALQRQYI